MGNCEICGAEKVGTTAVSLGRAKVDACSRCIDSMNLNPIPPNLENLQHQKTKISGGYGGGGVAGKDLMARGSRELVVDFASRIIRARESKGLDKRQLGQKIAEKFNVIQAVEAGKTPTDSLIRKLEKFFDIELMVEISPEETRMVGQAKARGLTLGDFFNTDEEV